MTRRQLETTVSSYGALAASYEKAAKGLQALRLLEGTDGWTWIMDGKTLEV